MGLRKPPAVLCLFGLQLRRSLEFTRGNISDRYLLGSGGRSVECCLEQGDFGVLAAQVVGQGFHDGTGTRVEKHPGPGQVPADERRERMNGAESLVHTLLGSGVEVCFANPGTSEMHFVAALDRIPGMRCILGLFEGVVTGAADGYARMAGKPAATLLHCGPGLANGLANLHNARRRIVADRQYCG